MSFEGIVLILTIDETLIKFGLNRKSPGLSSSYNYTKGTLANKSLV